MTDFTIRETPEERQRIVAVDGTMRNTMDRARVRLVVVGVVFMLCCLAVVLRLTELAVFKHADEPDRDIASVTEHSAARADIVDRNGDLLATSLETASLYADPAKVLDAKDAAKKLVTVFPDLTYGEVLQKLQSEERFVWIKRDITPKQEYQVQMLGLPGLDYRNGETRIYPFGPGAVHVVGFTDIDGKGMAGVERSFNSLLNQGGAKPLQLSIDMRIQHIMRRELAQAIEDFNGIGGCGIVMDVHTGEVLSMVSLPDFDPHDAGSASEEARFNRNTLGVYEMGSTFKVFTTAMALDSGKVKLTDSFNVAPYHAGKFVIHDFERIKPWLTVPEIFEYSSNIGSLQEALVVGTEDQQRYLTSLGMTRPSPIELPEIGAPLAPHPWSRINTMTIGFGHGMSVSPIQLATGVSAIIDGGVMHKPTLIKQASGEQPEGVRVISPETSELMKKLMRLQVVEGTGKNANVDGYLVGGKTGTAEKVKHGVYGKKALLSSFVGVFPMTDPKYLVLAMVDEPKPNAHSAGFATGGWVSAPAVGRVISQIGPLLNLDPIETTSEVTEAMALPTDGQIHRVSMTTSE
jgi:cell division protein FtsI (penicillin-binding protein 3)